MRFCTLLLLFFLSLTVIAQKPGKKDHAFAVNAAKLCLLEKKLCSLAESHTTNEEVKLLANTFLSQSAGTCDTLRNIALTKGMLLPLEPDSEAEKMIRKTDEPKGDAFDKEFLQNIQKVQRQLTQLFSKESKNGKDPEFKKFARAAKIKADTHLELIKETRKRIAPL